MLIRSPRHRPDDLARWEYLEKLDRLNAGRPSLNRKIERSIREIFSFSEAGPCYCGVSWGKDSVVLAHLVLHTGLGIPLVKITPDERENPDTALVRDEFLSRFPTANFHEFFVPRKQADDAHGFDPAVAMFGPRYISGVRADESGTRKMGLRKHGLSTGKTCSPLGWWKGDEIFAYLWVHRLPVHPAYACSQGGLWDRVRLRVHEIGGERGSGVGRAEWERYYYPEV